MKMILKSIKKLKSLSAVVLISTILVFQITGGTVVSAASYEGKGTKSSPYLVTNAEQLDGMRNKLSAHYKLANTIDMSSIANFTPIGDNSKEFTGSFTCDKGSDGKPLYIIKNLTVNPKLTGCTKAEKFSGYKGDDKPSGWEIGLFGSTKGATLENIVVLNANVVSPVEGLSSMNSDWSGNAGTAQQGTGILIGFAVNTTVKGCGSSGTVTSKSNNTGGLIGALTGKSTLSRSYSYATVTSTGTWSAGGLLGSTETQWGKYVANVKISECFYNGTFSGGVTGAGAFCGPVPYKDKSTGDSVTVENCWAGGTVKTASSGCFFGTDNLNTIDDVDFNYVKNCYTLCKIEGRTKAQTNKKVTNNCYITDEPGGLEIGFAAASMAEINAAFKNISVWTVTDGAYPQLKNVNAVNDASAYTPGAAQQSNSDNQDSKTDSDTAAADNTDDTQSDTKKSANQTGVNVVVNDKLTAMGTAELVLIIVLVIAFVALSAFGVWTIILIRKFLSANAVKETKNEDADKVNVNSDN